MAIEVTDEKGRVWRCSTTDEAVQLSKRLDKEKPKDGTVAVHYRDREVPKITIDKHYVTGKPIITIDFPGKHPVVIYPHVFPADHVTIISHGDVPVMPLEIDAAMRIDGI